MNPPRRFVSLTRDPPEEGGVRRAEHEYLHGYGHGREHEHGHEHKHKHKHEHKHEYRCAEYE